MSHSIKVKHSGNTDIKSLIDTIQFSILADFLQHNSFQLLDILEIFKVFKAFILIVEQ